MASPRAVGRPSARPCAPPHSRLLSPGAPPRARQRRCPHPTWRGGSAVDRSRVPVAGGASRSWKRVFCLLLSTPCAWSCRFQEEELRGTSLGSRAARGARLSSAPLLVWPSPACLGSRGVWSVFRELGGGRCPGPRAAGRSPQTSELPAPACFAATTREEGLGKGRHRSLLLWAPLETLKNVYAFQ